MSMQAAALVVLAAATFIPVSDADALFLEALPELSKEDVTPQPRHQSRKVLSAEPGAPAVSLEGAKFIPFKWGVEEITEPEWDSFKYENEISALLDSPLSDWAVIPEVCLMSPCVVARLGSRPQEHDFNSSVCPRNWSPT